MTGKYLMEFNPKSLMAAKELIFYLRRMILDQHKLIRAHQMIETSEDEGEEKSQIITSPQM